MAKSVAIFVPVKTLVIICVLVSIYTAQGSEGITCDDVKKDICPCLSYIAGGGVLTGDCCDGLIILVNEAQTKAEHQTACSCFKTFVGYLKDEELQRFASLPIPCGVQLPFVISRNMDCSKVN